MRKRRSGRSKESTSKKAFFKGCFYWAFIKRRFFSRILSAPVLHKRFLADSDAFEAHWTYHQEREFENTHAARYADPGMLRRIGN